MDEETVYDGCGDSLRSDVSQYVVHRVWLPSLQSEQ